jgi:hypothetical protein
MTNYTFQSLFDFARATSGTFVGSNGLIQNTPASVNLLTFTQQFDNAAWTKTAATVTANTTVAPDGTSTADTLTAAATSGTHLTNQSLNTTATATTFSVYAKQNGYNWLGLGITDSGGVVRVSYFNLTDGTVGTVASGITASIVNAGNGWYRCIVTVAVAQTGANTSRIYVTNADGVTSFTGDGTSGIFVWGAQLEVDSTATTYTRNNGGRFPPRFDYDPVTLAPKGILIEEQRVNLLTYSEQFDNAAWSKINSTITPDATTSPDGTVDAEKLIAADGIAIASCSIRSASISKSAVATTYTYTAYAKASEFNRVRLYIQDAATTANISDVTVSLVDGSITSAARTIGTFSSASAVVLNAGAGWWRVCLTFTSSTETALFARIYTADSTATTGNGTSGLFIYGAQLEAGSFATSYIPTVASQVTRARDVCGIVAPNFAPWYNQSEGTFVVSYDVGSTASALPKTTAVVHDGTTSNRIYGYLNVGGPPVVLVTTGGAVQASLVAASVSADTVNQMAFAYRDNDVALSSNGGAVLTDTSATMPTVDQLGIGGFTPTAAFLNGHIRSVRYYPVRLADFQLQALSA